MEKTITGLDKLGIGYAESVRLYVPSNIEGVEVDNSDRLMSVRQVMAETFGGCTTYTAHGSWMGQAGEVRERVDIVESFTDKLGNEQVDKVIDLAEWLKRSMSQEAVSLEVNGVLYFI